MRRVHVLLVAVLVALLGNVTAVPRAVADPVTSDQDRFVTLWDTRFHSGDAFQAYLDSDQQYDDGFNGYPDDQKLALVDALVRYWEANEPGFSDGIDYSIAPGDIPPTRDPIEDEDLRNHLADGGKPSRELIVDIVYRMVFDKAELKKELLAASGSSTGVDDPAGTRMPLPDDPTQPRTPSTPASDPLALITDTLAQAQDEVDKEVPVDTGAAPLAAPRYRYVAPDNSPRAGATVPTPPATWWRSLQRSTVSYSTWRERGFALNYTACVQEPGQGPVCDTNATAGVVLAPLPPVAGSQVPVGSYAKFALSVVVTPDPGNPTQPATLGLRLQVDYDPAGPLARAWIEYEPVAGRIVRLGFGGSDNGLTPFVPLQPRQTFQTTFSGLSLATAVLDTTSHVTYTGTALATVAAEVGYHDTAGGIDTLARVTVTAAPPAFDLDACQTVFVTAVVPVCGSTTVGSTTPASLSVVRLRHDPGLAKLPDVAVFVHTVTAARDQTVTASLPAIPNSVEVRAAHEVTGKTTITFNASAPIDRVDAKVRTILVGNDPVYWQATASLATMPSSVVVVVEQKHVNVTSSAAVTPASGAAALDATYQTGIPGTPDTVYESAHLAVSNLPQTVDLSFPLAPVPGTTAQARVYTVTTDATINHIDGSLYSYAQQIDVAGAVDHVPAGTFTLRVATDGAKSLAWQSPPAIDHVDIHGHVGVWQFGVDVTTVPTSWSMQMKPTALVGDAPGTGSTIYAWATNDNQVPVPAPHTNYATIDLTQYGTVTQVSAAFKLTGLQHVSVTPGTAPTANTSGTPAQYTLQAGSGGDFWAYGRLLDATKNKRTVVDALVAPFPGQITASHDLNVTDVVVSTNVNLDVYVEAGTPATLAQVPAPPTVHGLAIRDAGTPGDTAVALRLHLTGLPTHLHIEKSLVVLDNFHPTVNRLQVDVKVHTSNGDQLVAFADLQNIPTGATTSFQASWQVTKNATTKSQTVHANVTASAPMGPLYVQLGLGTFGGFAEVSNVPASMTLDAYDIEGGQVVSWTASDPIASVFVGIQVAQTANSLLYLRGSLHLTDVPRSWTLTLGRDSTGLGPRLSFTQGTVAPATGMDIDAAATNFLQTPGATLAAQFGFQVTDLRLSSAFVKVNKSLVYVGDGIASIHASVSAYVNATKSAGIVQQPLSWLRYGIEAGVGVEAIAAMFTVDISGIRALALTPGYITTVSGDFSAFSFGWLGLVARVYAYADAYVEVNVIKWWKLTIVGETITTPYIPVGFDVFRKGEGDIVSAKIPFTGGKRLYVSVRPVPMAYLPPFLAGTVLPGTPGATSTYWVTPDVVPVVHTAVNWIVMAAYAYGSAPLHFRIS